MYLLDTNVVSELRKASSGKVDKHVINWASSLPTSSLYISAITIFELERGILLKERKFPDQGMVLRAWFDNRVLPAFADRVLPVDALVARKCAKLHIPNPRPERDALILATALVHGLVMVTRNISDFHYGNIQLINPWLKQ